MMSILGPELDAELAYRRERLLHDADRTAGGHRWLFRIGRGAGVVARSATRRRAIRRERPV